VTLITFLLWLALAYVVFSVVCAFALWAACRRGAVADELTARIVANMERGR
jgi:hypothetical protein